MVDVTAELGHLKKVVRLHCVGKPDAASSCPSGLEGAGRKRTPAKVQRAALPPYAVRYLIHGGDAFSLQKILGHTSLEMTRKYGNLASEDVKEMHRRLSPMDNLGFRVKGRGRPKLK